MCMTNQPGTSSYPYLGMPTKLHKQVARSQEPISKLWEELNKRSLMVLIFMKEAQCKHHILNGIKDA